MAMVRRVVLASCLVLVWQGCDGSQDATAVCGDGRADAGEECDGSDLHGNDCVGAGDFMDGTLSCTPLCVFDVSSCRCATNEIPLILTIKDGVADSQVVPVIYGGVEGYLGIDTGSPITFVFGEPGDPDYVPHIGDMTIGCEVVPVALLTVDAFGVGEFQGKPLFGLLGLDFFSAFPTELDYPGRRVVRHLAGGPDLSGTTACAAQYEESRILIDDVTLGGNNVRLSWDAGSHHTIWVGVNGEAGDKEVSLMTADGAATVVFEGTTTLAIGDETERTITVWRAPSFPYLADELNELGASGLLGVTGMGFRKIIFDKASNELWLGEATTP
jgi:hypothetical protein